MAKILYTVTEDLRSRLKEPLGDIVEDIEEGEYEGMVICVGDVASEDALKIGMEPKIIVYDNKVKRKEIETPGAIRDYDALEIRVENPPGHLTEEALTGFKRALDSAENVKMLVDGEEDLITLFAIKLAPLGASVFYGQPDEGLVVVNVNGKIKKEVDGILDSMKNES